VLYPHRPTPEAVFEILTRHRPTIFFGVPTLYAGMLAAKEAERRWDLSSLRLCVSAGEALPDEIYARWRSASASRSSTASAPPRSCTSSCPIVPAPRGPAQPACRFRDTRP
jgi:acyl-coenzyme A synthetase/AMP-(fatty) acid ligase